MIIKPNVHYITHTLTKERSEALWQVYKTSLLDFSPIESSSGVIAPEDEWLVPPEDEWLLHWIKIRDEARRVLSGYKKSLLTKRYAMLNHAIRQIYTYELKQAIKDLRAEQEIVTAKMNQAEEYYWDSVACDPWGEPRGDEDEQHHLYSPWGYRMCYGYHSRTDGRALFKERGKLLVLISVLEDVVVALERGTPAEAGA